MSQELVSNYAGQVVFVNAPIRGVSLPGTSVLEIYLRPVLRQVNHFTLPVTPTIDNANSHWIHPDRNEKRVEHVKCFHAISEQLQLVQISNILRLNVLV